MVGFLTFVLILVRIDRVVIDMFWCSGQAFLHLPPFPSPVYCAMFHDEVVYNAHGRKHQGCDPTVHANRVLRECAWSYEKEGQDQHDWE